MMKTVSKSAMLSAVTLGGGALGLLLRLWQFHGGRDSEGLFLTGHPSGWLLLVLSVAVIAALFYLTRHPGGKGRYFDNFPPSQIGALGAIVGACVLFFTSLGELIGKVRGLSLVCAFFGIATAFSLGFTGYCRSAKNRRRPAPLFHAVALLFFTLRLICSYRVWSSEPLVPLFVWELLATACLMLAAFHRLAFDANQGNRQAFQFWGLVTVYFCILSMVRFSSLVYYGGMGLWLMTNLCTLRDLPEDPKPAEDEEDAEKEEKEEKPEPPETLP